MPFHSTLSDDVLIRRQDSEALATVWTIEQERDRSDVDRRTHPRTTAHPGDAAA